MQTSASNNRGFTLIEMMTAILILTVGLLGLLQAVNIAIEHNLKNRLRDTGVMIGERQINGLIKMPFDDAITNRYTTVTAVSGAIHKPYRVERTKENITSDSKRYRVNVQWTFKNVTTNHEVIAVDSR